MRLPKTKAERAIAVAIGYVVLVMTYFIYPVATLTNNVIMNIFTILILQPVLFGFVVFICTISVAVPTIAVVAIIVQIVKWIMEGE